MQAWLREGNIGASHVAIPECSLRAKRTRGLESKLESLAGFGLHIRSPRVHVRPLAMFQRARRSGYIRLATDKVPRDRLAGRKHRRDHSCWAPAGAGARRLRLCMRALAAEARYVGRTR
jgi:hypothetical protein